MMIHLAGARERERERERERKRERNENLSAMMISATYINISFARGKNKLGDSSLFTMNE
jgi:hypothetical protein